MQDRKEERRSAPLGAAPSEAPGPQTLRRRFYQIVEAGHGEDGWSKAFDTVIVTLIVLNVAAFALETVPQFEAAYGPWFERFEIFSVAVFTIEYLLRLWTAVEVPFLRRLPGWKARLRFASSGPMVIDLIVIAPFYLAHLLSIDLRVLRILRLIRFFKVFRYSPAMHTLLRVLYNERRSLQGAGLLLLAALLFASSGMYYFEHGAQPDKFGSVPQTAYWAMTTLTTVGYGDAVPITAAGKAFAMLVMIAGLCILALPVAIISTGFAQEVGRRDFVITWSLVSRIPMMAELEATEVAQIMPLLHAHNYTPGIEVIGAGTLCPAMYFVASGRVELVSPSGRRVFETGDFFGAVSMLEHDITAGPYRTLSRCRLLKLHKEDFGQLEGVSPALGAHIRTVSRSRKLQRQQAERSTGHTVVVDA